MRKVFMAVFLALTVAVLSFSPVSAQGNNEEMNDVFVQTENVRELKASPDVPVNYLSRDELKNKMLEDFETENPEEDLRDAQEIMVMLGFIEPDLDLQDLYVDLYTEQIAGFYDPEDNNLYLISEEKREMSAMDRYTLSHELTHYLEDQNFDLTRPPFDDPEDAAVETEDDAAFAATCLVEGDAMITSDEWLSENVDLDEMMDMQSEAGEYSTKVFDSAPEYIRDSLLFPYQEGESFVDYIHGKGGYDAVDRAYKNPPQTTEQIYHPEKYTANERVIEVDLPDISGSLGEGWELAYDNVLGEFDVYELFKPYFSRKTARLAADGWGGNRYHYYRGNGGDKLLVQGYAWDSEQDAQEFSSAYIKYLKSRFGKELREEPSSGAWMTWSTDDYLLGLKKDGVETYLVQSTDGEPFDAIMSELGDKGSRIDESAIVEEAEKKGGEKDYRWVVIGVVIGLMVLGLILLVVMLILYRRPPAPPCQPPGGPYGPYIYPGGGPGPYYGPPSGYGGPGGPPPPGPPEPPSPPSDG